MSFLKVLLLPEKESLVWIQVVFLNYKDDVMFLFTHLVRGKHIADKNICLMV